MKSCWLIIKEYPKLVSYRVKVNDRYWFEETMIEEELMRVKFMKACVLLVMVVCIEFLVRFRMGVVKVVVAKDTITQRSRISKDDLTYKRVSRHF